jgi:hypothetical protein
MLGRRNLLCRYSPKSKSYYWRSVCLGVRHTSGTRDHLFLPVFCYYFRQLRVCWCGAPSLTRGQVCSFQLLLSFASRVSLGSESRGIRNHVLFSHWDSPNLKCQVSEFISARNTVSNYAPRHCVSASPESKYKSHYDWRSVSQYVSMHFFGLHNQMFVMFHGYYRVFLGRLLRWEVRSVVCQPVCCN